MALLIDTSVFVRHERAGLPADALLASLGDEQVALAAITASELLHGVERASSSMRRATRATWVEAVLGLLPVLPFDLEVARVHARLWADLSARGALIGAHDLLIAATALRWGHGVLTANEREFARVEGLRVVSC